MTTSIGDRKSSHLALCETGEVGFRGLGTGFDEVRLVHDALPELAYDEVDPRVTLFGKELRAPIVIAAMTGGTEEAERVNRTLAAVAEARGYAFGLGSQRAMHVRPEVTRTFQVRTVAPTALIFGNLGVVQANRMSVSEVRDLVEGVGADALCVHLNPAMELVQPGGDRDFRGGLDTIARLVEELGKPVIVKETGCGLSAKVAVKLRRIGVRNVDVSGAGGTSWVGVETLRAEEQGDARARALGEALWDWGVPTAASVALVAPHGFDTIIATGGVSRGLDIAKAIALGATAGGIARPLLKAVRQGGAAEAERLLQGVEDELRAAMLLTGSADLTALRGARKVLGAGLRTWLTDAGENPGHEGA